MVTYNYKDHEYRLPLWKLPLVCFWDFRKSRPRILFWIIVCVLSIIIIRRLLFSNPGEIKQDEINGDEINPKFKDKILNAPKHENKNFQQNQHQQENVNPPKQGINNEPYEINKILKENEVDILPPKFGPLDRKFPERGHERHAPLQNGIRYPEPKDFPKPILLEPRLNCASEKVLVILLVENRPDNTGGRLAIRSTWGTQDLIKFPHIPPHTWKTIFVMGKLSGINADYFNNAVREEHKKYGDILMADFEDTPHESTRKFMTALKWLNEHDKVCPTKFILKTKDNIFHNMFSITEWLQKKWSRDDKLIYAGKLRRKDPPIRDFDNPLVVNEKDFGDEFFPDMIEEPIYLFDWAAFVKIYKSMKFVTPIAMEDGYISILSFTSGIKPQHNDHFQLLGRPRDACAHLKIFFINKMLPKEHIEIFTLNKNSRSQGLCPEAKIVYQRGQHAKRVDFDT